MNPHATIILLLAALLAGCVAGCSGTVPAASPQGERLAERRAACRVLEPYDRSRIPGVRPAETQAWLDRYTRGRAVYCTGAEGAGSW